MKTNKNTGPFKAIVLALVFIHTHHRLEAQESTVYPTFLFQTQRDNPAAVGWSGAHSLVALHRAQWVGIVGAPKTQMLYYSSPTKRKKLGLGFGVVQDKIGPTTATVFNVDISYTLPLPKDQHIAFGLKTTIYLNEVNYNLLIQDLRYGPDPALYNPPEQQFAPNFGAGLLYYSHTFYIGLSLPRFLEPLPLAVVSLGTLNPYKPIYFKAGFAAPIYPRVLFRPSLRVKAISGGVLQTDFAATWLLKERVSLGVSYRVKAAVSGLAGYRFSNDFFVGLAYDRATTAMGQDLFNTGSLGVVFRYLFKKNTKTPTPLFLF